MSSRKLAPGYRRARRLTCYGKIAGTAALAGAARLVGCCCKPLILNVHLLLYTE